MAMETTTATADQAADPRDQMTVEYRSQEWKNPRRGTDGDRRDITRQTRVGLLGLHGVCR